MLFRQIFDPKLAQYAYLIGCQKTNEAIIIDPERDIDQYVELAESEGLNIVAIAETHIHERGDYIMFRVGKPEICQCLLGVH